MARDDQRESSHSRRHSTKYHDATMTKVRLCSFWPLIREPNREGEMGPAVAGRPTKVLRMAAIRPRTLLQSRTMSTNGTRYPKTNGESWKQGLERWTSRPSTGSHHAAARRAPESEGERCGKQQNTSHVEVREVCNRDTSRSTTRYTQPKGKMKHT